MLMDCAELGLALVDVAATMAVPPIPRSGPSHASARSKWSTS